MPRYWIVVCPIGEMKTGDKLTPFPKKWRIGPIGTVKMKKVSDEEFNPMIQAAEGKHGRPSFGRRIEVEWEISGMPLNGTLASVPEDQRPKRALALHTIEE